MREWATGARERGLRVIIAAAGKAAHLAGVVAAFTPLPIVGVPMKTSDLGGMDSLLSMVQMPSGVPVACVAIGGAKNAAIYATQILATADSRYVRVMEDFKRDMAEGFYIKKFFNLGFDKIQTYEAIKKACKTI